MGSRVRSGIRSHREVWTIAVAGAGVVGFAWLTPPLGGPETYSWLPPLAGLAGDLPEYAWRFAMSFVLLGLAPLAASLALGERLGDLGLRAPRQIWPGRAWAMVAVASIAVAAAGAWAPGTSTYYPYSRTLFGNVSTDGYWTFGLHAALYLLLFYLPWELLFRGILVFPILRLASGASRPALLALASLPAIPSALLHIGHPAMESLGAVAFGIGAAWLALETGSILPGLAVHAGIGILQDFLIVLRLTGALP